MGDLENALAINSIILIPKKVIYSCMKREHKMNRQFVKNDIKNLFAREILLLLLLSLLLLLLLLLLLYKMKENCI